MIMSETGQCLCGEVQLTFDEVKPHVEACHCSTCRRWGGGPLMGVQAGSVTANNADAITAYASSEWAKRAFCSQCGTHLYYKLNDADVYFVPAGLLNNMEGRPFVEEIFIDQKPDYYAFSNDTAKLTGEEVFAKYAASQAE